MPYWDIDSSHNNILVQNIRVAHLSNTLSKDGLFLQSHLKEPLLLKEWGDEKKAQMLQGVS